MIIAPIGVLFGLIPLTGFLAVIAAVVAIPLALVGLARVRRGHATNSKTSWLGLGLGAVALALGIWGMTIVFTTLDQLSGPAPIAAGPNGAQAPVAGVQPPAAGTTTAGFGESITFDNGIVVQITQPQAYKPSRYAAGHDGARAVVFEVTVTNNSSEPLDAVTVWVNSMFEGRPASPIFDSGNGGSENPTGTVLPSKSTTFRTALSLPSDSPGELQVEVRPGFIGDPAIFTGQV